MTLLFNRLSLWLDRTSFPRVEDTKAEASKVALLRIAAGAVLVWRCGFLLRDTYYFFDPLPFAGGLWPLHALASAGQLILAVGLMLGVAPASCAFLLLATHPVYSVWNGTYNLGPMLLTPTLGALAVLETGRYALAARVRPTPPSAHYRIVYFILFVAYAAWSFQALLYHVRDDYWIGGQTSAVLFTNSYLSEFYPWFRFLERAAPAGYFLASIAIGVLQSVFQLGMLPLIVSRWGMRFVAIWGSVFIFGSLADLQLSILPIVEIIMWALIFAPGRWFARSQSAPHAAGIFPSWRIAATALFCAGYGLMLALFFGNAITTFFWNRGLPVWVESRVFVYAGLIAPNVFNRQDLTMGDHWAVVERLDGPHAGILPLNGAEGERFAYHRSDLLYFRNSLRWRRGMIGQGNQEAYHQAGAGGYEYAREMARYDYRRHGGAGPGLYRFRIFQNRASEFSLGADPARYRPEFLFEFTIQVGAQTP